MTQATTRPWADLVADDWAEALAPVAGQLEQLGAFLRSEVHSGRSYLPAPGNILRAFSRPMSQVKVLIVGQDPYPTPGHPVGLSFSVDRQVRPIPRSLANIYSELRNDLAIEPAGHGDLSAWVEQGVLLLNRVLTVRPGQPGSHRGKGWEVITEHALGALAARDQPLVAILWGAQARKLKSTLHATPCIESAHPSPLSAHHGFFGSAPFSRANELLTLQGAAPVDWRL